MPIKLRSRQQTCRMASMPASCWMRWAVMSEEIRAGPRAVGNVDRLHAMLFQGLALGHGGAQIVAAGGTNSTVVTHCRAASRAASCDLPASGAGSFSGAAAETVTTAGLNLMRPSGLTAWTS